MAIRKRASSTGSAGGAKKQRVVLKQCNAVKQAVLRAETYPAKVLKMVSNNLPACLGVPKEDRHAHQEKVIQMVGDAIAAVDASLRKATAEIEEKHGSMNTQKATRDKDLEDAAVAVTEKSAAFDAAKTAAAEAAAATKAAEGSVSETAKEQQKADTDLEKATMKKTKLDGVLNMHFVPIKEGSVAGPVAKKCIKELEAFAKDSVMDASMVASLPAALAKAPEERGSFDGMVLQQLEEELGKKIKDSEDLVTNGEQEKADWEAKVNAQNAALENAKAHDAASAEKQTKCKDELAEAKAAHKAAKQAVAQFGPDMKQVEKDLADAKAEYESFTGGASAAYKELLEYTAIAAPAPASGELS